MFYSDFVSTIANLLCFTVNQSFMLLIFQVVSEILRIGEEKEGLINVLIFALCKWWKEDATNLCYGLYYIDVFVQAILFGPVHSKGKR